MSIVRQKVDPIVHKAGFTVSYGGQFEAQQSATRTILLTGFIIAVLMLMLLQISTGSLRAALLVMLNMPLALIGGIIAILLTEGGGAWSNILGLVGFGGDYVAPVISIASMVGFITLFGISIRNGYPINHYNHLIDVEGQSIGNAIIQGSMERLVPILMTAISAALGLLPLALAAGKPGSELLASLAIVTPEVADLHDPESHRGPCRLLLVFGAKRMMGRVDPHQTGRVVYYFDSPTSIKGRQDHDQIESPVNDRRLNSRRLSDWL